MSSSNPLSKMGISNSQSHTHKCFLLANYMLIGAAASCIFLTISLRLVPSLIGGLLILLHLLTITSSISSCSSSSDSSPSPGRQLARMAATVLAAIMQGAVALLVFTRTGDFLWRLKSYVQEDDGVVILRMAGALGLVMFVLEWVVLVLDFAMRFYVFAEDGNGAKVRQDEDEGVKDWPWPFQV